MADNLSLCHKIGKVKLRSDNGRSERYAELLSV